MKKILVLLILIFLFTLWWKFGQPHPIHFSQPIQRIPLDQIDPAVEHIRSVNRLYLDLRTLSCEVELTVKQHVSHRISGKLMFEKDRRMRIVCWSKMRKEIDIGSNDKFFWFWSSRMKPPTLYYCPQTHVSRNRLRSAFHPLWIMETLSVSEIDLAESSIVEQGDNYVVIQIRTSTTGDPIIKTTLVSKTSHAIVGHYIFDSRGKMIISTEVEEFQNVAGFLVPLRMRTVWYEEDIILLWKLNKVRVNVDVDPDSWKMPDVRNKQDIKLG